jgi:hypothetical protein
MNKYYNPSIYNLTKYLKEKKDVSIQTEDTSIQTKDASNLDEYNNMPRIIGVTGKKFNGKDTLGNYLSKYNYKRMAFADPLKQVIKNIFDFNDEQLYGENKEKIDDFWKISPRSAMQFIGTDLFRHQMNKLIPEIGDEIWIKVVKRQIENIWKNNPNQKIVITDVRFPNECNLIRELGGIIIRVKRKIEDIHTDSDFIIVHESETYINALKVDYDFDNNKTKIDLYKQFDDLYK